MTKKKRNFDFTIPLGLCIILLGFSISIAYNMFEKSYSTSQEVFNEAEFSGDLKDLEYCNVMVKGENENIIFPFIGSIGDVEEECHNIKQICEFDDYPCYWKVELSAETSGINNKWKPSWTGNCYCDLREKNELPKFEYLYIEIEDNLNYSYDWNTENVTDLYFYLNSSNNKLEEIK